MSIRYLTNPYKPGAGHQPPYLAGRDSEMSEFQRFLGQSVILENVIITGLRGVGKTVLLDKLKPLSQSLDWLWVGTDLSESSVLSEERISIRLLTDLSVVTASLKLGERSHSSMGFLPAAEKESVYLNYATLTHLYDTIPGLASDKLKAILELVWDVLKETDHKGLVFAYDESQNLSDRANKGEFPSSLLLEVFQSIQRKGIPFMLVLAGLPTLLPRLIECRTYSERMFHVLFLDKLKAPESRDAILQPIKDSNCPVRFSNDSVDQIIKFSGGYPYFIQFICREAFDAFLGGQNQVPFEEITRKLDADFFAGRWARATDRQRELLITIAELENSSDEFSVQEIAEKSKKMKHKSFSPSHVSQILNALDNAGLIYKNRHGKYSLAVPLLDDFVRRQAESSKAPF
ncbi:MAG: ATP-binding protein [Cyanobacteria bacterium J06635_15]